MKLSSLNHSLASIGRSGWDESLQGEWSFYQVKPRATSIDYYEAWDISAAFVDDCCRQGRLEQCIEIARITKRFADLTISFGGTSVESGQI